MGERELIAGECRRVYVKSFGCPTNIADGECIVACLSKAGYEVVENVADADILIYNTCAVKTPTENRMISVLRRTPADKRVVVTGCLPLTSYERLRAQVKFDGVLGPAPGSDIVDAIGKVCRGEKVIVLQHDSKPSLDLPRTHVNKAVGIVPINYGCLGSCSYCCVLFARGRLRSYQLYEVVKRVQHDLASGVKEIWLTSQDTACYGKDIAVNLTDLLSKVCEAEEKFFIRIGMMTPNHALNLLDDLVDAYRNEKIFKFLHLPFQSGDDRVLRLMNRQYSVEDFKKVIHTFRKRFPKITIATDVICGFPGENRGAFEHTLQLIEEVQPDILNISKFFPRPRTPAAEMKQLPPQEVNERSRAVAELAREVSFGRNQGWLGWEGEIVVDEEGKKPTSWVGRNFAYKPIVMRSDEILHGKFVDVRVVRVFPTYLEAEII